MADNMPYDLIIVYISRFRWKVEHPLPTCVCENRHFHMQTSQPHANTIFTYGRPKEAFYNRPSKNTGLQFFQKIKIKNQIQNPSQGPRKATAIIEHRHNSLLPSRGPMSMLLLRG